MNRTDHISSQQQEIAPVSETDRTPLVRYAVGLLKQRKWTEATVAHKQLIESGHEAVGYYGLGVIAIMNRNYDEALQSLLKCIERHPHTPEAYFHIGNILQRKGDLAGAKDYFRKTIEANPKHQGAMNKIHDLNASHSQRSPADSKPLKPLKTFNEPDFSPGFYEILKLDAASKTHSSLISKHALVLIDRLDGEYRPQESAFRSKQISLVIYGATTLLLVLLLSITFDPSNGWILGFVMGIPLSALIVIMFRLYLRARIDNTVYRFNQGRVQVESCILWRFRRNFELYRLTHATLYQTWLNRSTQDGTLLLVFNSPGLHVPSIIRLKGLAKVATLECILENLRQLAVILRMHPLLKGIIN